MSQNGSVATLQVNGQITTTFGQDSQRQIHSLPTRKWWSTMPAGMEPMLPLEHAANAVLAEQLGSVFGRTLQ